MQLSCLSGVKEKGILSNLEFSSVLSVDFRQLHTEMSCITIILTLMFIGKCTLPGQSIKHRARGNNEKKKSKINRFTS